MKLRKHIDVPAGPNPKARLRAAAIERFGHDNIEPAGSIEQDSFSHWGDGQIAGTISQYWAEKD